MLFYSGGSASPCASPLSLFINVLLLLLIPLTYKSWIYFIFISFNVLFLAWQLGHVSGSFTSSPAFADPQDSRTPPSSAEPGFEGPLFSDLSLWILLHDHNLFKGLLKTSLWLGEAQSKLKCVSRKHAWLHGCLASVASLQPCQAVSLIQWKCDLAFPGIINKLVHSPVCPSGFCGTHLPAKVLILGLSQAKSAVRNVPLYFITLQQLCDFITNILKIHCGWKCILWFNP